MNKTTKNLHDQFYRARRKALEAEDRRKTPIPLCDIWADASFFNSRPSRKKYEDLPERDYYIGGGSVVFVNNKPTMILVNDLNDHDVRASHKAEMLNLVVTLERMQVGEVRSITCDNYRVIESMQKILDGNFERESLYPASMWKRLIKSMGRHPHLEVRHVPRGEEHIPIAHVFAQCAAVDNRHRMARELRYRFGREEEKPTIFHTTRTTPKRVLELPKPQYPTREAS